MYSKLSTIHINLAAHEAIIEESKGSCMWAIHSRLSMLHMSGSPQGSHRATTAIVHLGSTQ